MGELVGTTLFLSLAFFGLQSTSLDNEASGTVALIYIAVSFGLSSMVSTAIFVQVTGAMFNPAVSFALAFKKYISFKRAILVSFSQILGGMAAAGLVRGIVPGPLKIGTNLQEGISVGRGKREIL